MDGAEQPDSEFRRNYRRTLVRRVLFISACVVLCLIVLAYSITLGTYPLSMSEVYHIIWDEIINMPHDNATDAWVVLELRMPRIIGAIVCGFALAICGTAMQSILKNPLADPYTMGISSGAGFGAALALILGIELVAGGGVVVNAFVFALIPMAVILLMSRFRRATPTMMILCGTSLMYIFNALTQLFMIVADPDDLSNVYTWMVGTLEDVTYGNLPIIIAVTVAGSLIVQLLAGRLNVMGAGDESARTLGVNVDRERLLVLILVTIVAATVVSFTGVIGFVGLVAPHVARIIVGSDNKSLLPAAGVLGSLLMLLADMASRLLTDSVLPVGVITACIGGPVFILLILRSNKEAWN